MSEATLKRHGTSVAECPGSVYLFPPGRRTVDVSDPRDRRRARSPQFPGAAAVFPHLASVGLRLSGEWRSSSISDGFSATSLVAPRLSAGSGRHLVMRTRAEPN